MLPERVKLDVSAAHAFLLRTLVAESAPFCKECAVLLNVVDTQLTQLNGGTPVLEG